MAGPGRVLVDSGFFIALFNERDRHHASARRLEEWLDFVPIVLPWPILYETVNTRLARRPENLAKFGAIVRLPATLLLDDSPYREDSLAAVLAQNPATGSLSLVDAVLCNVIEDANVPVSAMLTFNDRDFLAVCLDNGVELLSADCGGTAGWREDRQESTIRQWNRYRSPASAWPSATGVMPRCAPRWRRTVSTASSRRRTPANGTPASRTCAT